MSIDKHSFEDFKSLLEYVDNGGEICIDEETPIRYVEVGSKRVYIELSNWLVDKYDLVPRIKNGEFEGCIDIVKKENK